MNTQPTKPALNMGAITQRLYTIRNIANLAAYSEKAEAYVLQDVIEHVSQMVHDLIETLEKEF